MSTKNKLPGSRGRKYKSVEFDDDSADEREEQQQQSETIQFLFGLLEKVLETFFIICYSVF